MGHPPSLGESQVGKGWAAPNLQFGHWNVLLDTETGIVRAKTNAETTRVTIPA
jgi:hypothetical protein